MIPKDFVGLPFRPMITKTFEPIRPLAAPEDGSAYAVHMITGGWRVHYGLYGWASRGYWIVPGTLDTQPEPWEAR